MNRLFPLACFLAMAALAGAQTVIRGGRTVDGPFKGPRGGTLPSTCAIGEEYFLTAAPAGSNKYLCAATNTWTVVNGTVLMQAYTAGTGGVTANSPVKLAADGTVVALTTSEGALGIAQSTVSANGLVNVVLIGPATCVAEGAVVAGNWVTAGASNKTRCLDSGQNDLTRIPISTWVVAKATASAADGQSFTADTLAPYRTGAQPKNGQITLIVGSADIGSTGNKACTLAETARTIVEAHLSADHLPTGANLVLDVKTIPAASYTDISSATTSITGSAKPTIQTTDASAFQTVNISSWTTAIAANTEVCVAVSTAPTGGSTQAVLTLEVQ